ncbi:hypothetical protein J4G37_39375, partial [Microvirga sp. 3-52]|nr:hypothetical protein [Microvirga sp. 3-52]
MTKLWASSILLLIVMFIIPVILLRGPGAEPQKEEKKIEQSCPIDIKVVGEDEPLALEEYVKGVVAGEMPIGFHPEALKAQSIA